MSDLFAPSLADQINCAAREAALRRRAYPRWIAGGRMTQEKADREIAMMDAVIETLKAVGDTMSITDAANACFIVVDHLCKDPMRDFAQMSRVLDDNGHHRVATALKAISPKDGLK